MRVFLFVLVAACGTYAPIVQGPLPEPKVARAGTPPATDEAALRAQLGGDGVQNTGLWFTEEACRAQFGKPGKVAPDAFDAFAKCVAGLHLRPSGRAHWADDASVLTDDAGFEIEARVVHGKLDFIGYAGRAPGMPDLPTITPEALEALRTAGDPRATITAEVAKRVVSTMEGAPPIHTEHLRVCLDEAGAFATVMPSTSTTPASAKAFTAIVPSWTFRPFTVAGVPTPVCAIVGFQYPAGTPERRLPQPPLLSKAGHIVYQVAQTDPALKRVKGVVQVVPDDDDKTRLYNQKLARVISMFKLCIDEQGHHDSLTILTSSGLPSYDAKIMRTMKQWEYRPYVVDRFAVPVCTVVTFVYSQTRR